MKFLAASFVLTFLFLQTSVAQNSSFRIEEFGPYAKAVPGQILQARVAGLGDSSNLMLEPKDLTVELVQDSTKLKAPARSAVSMFVSRPDSQPIAAGPPDFSKMQALIRIDFVVPHGLHTGEVDVVVVYSKQRSQPAKLTILERPEPPVIGSTTVERVSVGPMSETRTATEMGLRLERGDKAQLYVLPLVDPKDPLAAVLISFKQKEKSYDADARVIHQDSSVEQLRGGVRFSPNRDFLEVQIPAGLEAGSAKMEVRVRANNQTSDVAAMPVLITDVNRVAELPAENAPRALVVSPGKVGAGQALMISVDHVRTLKPDPQKAMVMFEQGGVRYTVEPEVNSAVFNPSKNDDSPVLLIVRPTRQIIGSAQVRVFNSLRGEQGGLSTPTSVEIVDEVFPPELISVAESTDADLASLRQMYEMQRAAGRNFPEYNPANRYLSIHVRGLDMSPEHIRMSLTQEGKTKTLGFEDFSSMSGELFIVRLPKEFHKGQVHLSVQNEGADKLSKPASASFDLSK